MTARKIFTTTAGVLTALALSMPAAASAQGFESQRSAAQAQYCENQQPGQDPSSCPGPGGTPPGQGGTPPGQGGTPPGQGNGNPGQGNGKPKGSKKGSGNVQGTGNKKKKGSGTLGDTEDGAGAGVNGAGGSGGGGNVLGANTTGSLERSGSLPFTGLEIWMLLALGFSALAAGLVTRRASLR